MHIIVFIEAKLIIPLNFYYKKKITFNFLNYSMPGKKKSKVTDPNNPQAKRTKNRKTKSKSNPIGILDNSQLSFFKAKYLSLLTGAYSNFPRYQAKYKKVGTSTKEIIAADIVLQYLENHNMHLTCESAICESSRDLKRKLTDLWIARKLQVRGKRDIIHGLVAAKKNNMFNVGFHKSPGSRNSSSTNIISESPNNSISKNNKVISKNESNDSIKLLNVRVIEKESQRAQQASNNSNSQKNLKKRKKKNNGSQQNQIEEIEEESPNQSKTSKKTTKKASRNQNNDEDNPNQLKNSIKKKKTKKEGLANDDNIKNNVRQQSPQYPQIEPINKRTKPKSKANKLNDYQQPIVNQNNNNNNFDNGAQNQDIDLNELPPPLGTDSSDDNNELYDYNVNTTDQNKKDQAFEVFDYNNDKSNIKSGNFDDDNFINSFDDKFGDISDIYSKKQKNFNARFNDNDNFDDKFDIKDNFNHKYIDKKDDFNNALNEKNNHFNGRLENKDNNELKRKENKSGRTRVKSTGGHTRTHTNSGHNSNNNSRTKIRQRSNLNEITHFYTYTYEEEDEVSDSTQYEYPTHIYEYEDFDEEEEKRNDRNSNKNVNNNFSNKNQNPETTFVTREIEIISSEIDNLNPIYPSNHNSNHNRIPPPALNLNLNLNKKFQNKNSKDNFSSSGSPQNHSTSSNSLHEQKIKLTLQQNVEMIQNPPEEEKKHTKHKVKPIPKEDTTIQYDQTSIIEANLVFETFHTVDVQPNLELQRIFKQRKGLKQKNSPKNNCEQIYFQLQNSPNMTKESQVKKIQQTGSNPNINNEEEEENAQEAFDVHIKIVEAVVFKDSGFESNIFKVKIKLASAQEFIETRESSPSPIHPAVDSNQLIAHHLWDEAFKIFCNQIENEKLSVSVLSLNKQKQQQKQRSFDVVSVSTIALKSFVVDEFNDVWINMKNIGRVHLLICIKNVDLYDDNYDVYNEEEEEEEEAEISENGSYTNGNAGVDVYEKEDIGNDLN